MQNNIKSLLNFDGEGVFELLGITEDRADEIKKSWDLLIPEIANNDAEYTYPGTGENAGQTGIHVGKCAAKMLHTSNTTDEELYALINLDIFIDKIMNAMRNNHFSKYFKIEQNEI